MSSTSKSKSALYRQKQKAENPEMYAKYLEQRREEMRLKRQQKKEKWHNEPHTRAMIQERKRENELSRLRMEKFRNKFSTKRKTRNSSLSKPDGKRPKDMSEEERKEHIRKKQREWRARQTPQKKRYIKEKDRAYQKAKRDRKRAARTPLPGPSTLGEQPHPPCTPIPSTPPLSRLPKTLHNLTSKFKAMLKKRSKENPTVYATIVKKLATPRTPEKRAAFRKLFCEKNEKAHPVRKSPKRVRRSTEEKVALYSSIKAFYLRQDVSRVLPHKRYATKAGPGYVMNITIKGAFRLFKSEKPNAKVQLTKFSMLRPKNVRKLGEVGMETCLCIYCLNVRYKVTGINRVLAKMGNTVRLPEEGNILKFFLCPKKEGANWHQVNCLNGTCSACHDLSKKLETLCQPYLDTPVSWLHWERRTIKDALKLDVFAKDGQLRDLLLEFVEKDLLQPVKGCSFVTHLFRATWQQSQYSELKNSLMEHELLMVMDFAENRKAMYNEEVKTAHFGKGQITLHPVVAFYKKDAQLVRHSLMFVTDDIQHDYHAVHTFTMKAFDFLLPQLPQVKMVYIFSDGCAAQYKGKGTFADLSLSSTVKFERVYFGSEHGKGEADGETGVLSQALHRAVCGNRATIKDAEDLFEWGVREFTKADPLFKRDFFLVANNEINRDRPGTDIGTLPGTRKMHHVKRVGDYVVQSRQLACFCAPCRSADFKGCLNYEYVGSFETFKLKPRLAVSTPTSSSLDVAFLDSPEKLPERNVPKVGDFIKVVFKVGKKCLTYTALVIQTSIVLQDDEFMVSYLRDHGNYYVFPAIEDFSIVSLADVDLLNVEVLSAPTIDNRNRHFFSF